MKQTLFLFIYSIISTCALFAQSDFKQGYVINLAQDTIKGYIDDRGEIQNCTKCRFKVSENSEIQEYLPGEIKGYRLLNDKFYISRQITINGVSTNRFVEYLLNGAVDLYLYRDVYSTYYFIQEKGKEPVELKQEKVEIHSNNRVYLKDNKEYLGVLISTFDSTPQLKTKIEKVHLTRNSLINISESYHNAVCPGEQCIIYKKDEKKFLFALSGTFGIIQETMRNDIGGANWERRYEFNKLEPIHKPLFGLALQAITPYNQRLFFQFEPFFYKSEYKSTYSQFIHYKKTSDFEYSTEYMNVICNFYLRYNLLKSKIHPVLYAGFNINGTFSHIDNGLPAIETEINKFLACGYATGLGLGFKINEKKEASVRFLYHHTFGSLMYMGTNCYSLSLALPIVTF